MVRNYTASKDGVRVVHWTDQGFNLVQRPVPMRERRYGDSGRGYYVGLDIGKPVHPQTLLVLRMNGRELTPEHGGPVAPGHACQVRHQNIKRIGTVLFTNTRPPDFWAERGYDWYAALAVLDHGRCTSMPLVYARPTAQNADRRQFPCQSTGTGSTGTRGHQTARRQEIVHSSQA